MEDWVRDAINKLNESLYSQGETPEKYFGKDGINKNDKT